MSLDHCLDSYKFSSSDKWVCLVSGGIDSMVLLDLIHRRSVAMQVDLTVVHFNFHLRGDESLRDEDFVRKQCEDRKISLLVLDRPLTKGKSVQQRAREIRREEVKRIGRQKGWTHIFMGHQSNDQIETLIMKMIRGAGVRGMRGMQKQQQFDDDFILCRPLLDCSRSEIEQYAISNHISFVTDSSNQSHDYFRNRVRYDIVPDLHKKYPGLIQELQSESIINAQKYDQIDHEVKIFFHCQSIQSSTKVIQKKDYLAQNEEVRFFIIERLIGEAGFVKQFETIHFHEIESLIQKEGCVEREYGPVSLVCGYTTFYFQSTRSLKVDPLWQLRIDEPGHYEIDPLKKVFSIKSLSHSSDIRFESHQTKGRALYVDQSFIQFPLCLRFSKNGDRFIPYGCKGSKKISDYFVDRKVNRDERSRALLLCCGSEIVCLVGYEISNQYRIKDPLTPCFRIAFT